jgi:glutamate-1-semialdehyde aminotransferase
MQSKNSDYFYNRALQYIPEGSQTKSKMACRFPENYPKFISRGKGSHIWDVDGNEYVDWVMGLGPVILGYSDDDVTNAVVEQMKDGNVFPLPSPLEAALADLLSRHISCAEMSRFARNGTDATMGAVRLARAITGRHWVAYCGYHGGADWYANNVIPNAGTINQPTVEFRYNNVDWILNTLPKLDIACVIMEILPEEPDKKWIETLIDSCHREGILFILDEVVTGFRYAMGGAQELFNLDVDIACFSKGMGNGFPISAICGKRKYMEHFDEIFFSTTFGGELTGIAAAKATIEKLYLNNGIDHIWKIGDLLRTGIRDIMEKYPCNAELKGNPARSLIVFKTDDGAEDTITKTVFLQEVIKYGVFMGVPIFPCYSHTLEDVERTLFAIRGAIKYIVQHRNDSDKGLIGKPISLIGSPRK